MQCPLCHLRPAKRACPALGENICSVCCGTKRLVEIRCPDTCTYLSSARRNPAAVVRRQQADDIDALLPALQGLSDGQQQLFLLTVTLADRFKGDGLAAAIDADVAAAAGALAATYEAEVKGVIYEQRPASPAAQALANGWKGLFDELGRSRPAAFAGDAAVVLRALERLIQSPTRRPDADPRAFLALAGRVARQFGEGTARSDRADGPSAEPPPSGLILP